MQVNLEQIAKIAGVSAKTVSKALREVQGVAPVTRERVRRIARDLGYEPYGPASAVRSGKVGLIGVLPPLNAEYWLGPWVTLMLGGFWKGAVAGGMQVVLLGSEGEQKGVPSMVARRFVEGAAFLARADDRVVEWMASRRMPVVTVDNAPDGGTDTVYPDDAGGIRAAIEHLVALGHKRIAYVNSPAFPGVSHQFSIGLRQNSYLKVMAELGLRAPAGSERNSPVEERVGALLANERPTALLCYDDHDAMQTIRALHERGLRVPEDISVVGIDDLEQCLLSSPRLTTVHVPFREMGERAAELLLQRLKRPNLEPWHVTLPEHLVVRDSTAPPRNEPAGDGR